MVGENGIAPSNLKTLRVNLGFKSTFYRVVIKKLIPLWRVQMGSLSRVATNGSKGNGKPLMNFKAYTGLPALMKLNPCFSVYI